MEKEENKISFLLKKHEELFEKVKNSKENSIDLSGSLTKEEEKIDDEKMIVISEALKINSSLNTIDLRDNNIGNEVIKYLSESLKINSSLKKIYLDKNKIGNEGIKYLSESLKINSSLKEKDLEEFSK